MSKKLEEILKKKIIEDAPKKKLDDDQKKTLQYQSLLHNMHFAGRVEENRNALYYSLHNEVSILLLLLL